jgi:hypothetical protein
MIRTAVLSSTVAKAIRKAPVFPSPAAAGPVLIPVRHGQTLAVEAVFETVPGRSK